MKIPPFSPPPQVGEGQVPSGWRVGGLQGAQNAMRTWKFAGVNFDHMHMGDLLRQVAEHPNAEIAGIADEDPARMQGTIAKLGIPAECVFTNFRRCIEETKPDVVILCPATGKHADYVEWVAPFGVN